MLEILQAPSHVAAFRLSGEVSGGDYEQLIAELEARLRMHPRIAVYADMTSLTKLARGAWGKDVRYRFTKRNQLHRFARAGFVSDKAWPRWLTTLARPFTPIELRTFHTRERDAALSWTSAAELERSRQPALRLIATTRPDTYAYVWDGKIERSDLERVVRLLMIEFESHIRVRLLGRIANMGGIEARALFTPGLLRFKLVGVTKIERYAIVGGPDWLARSIRGLRRIFDSHVRHFPLEREAEAWTWLEAQPASPSSRATLETANAQRGPLN